MMRAHMSGIRWLRTIIAAVAVLGFMAVISLPVGLALPGDNIEQKIRQAKTPADHQALAAWYEKEAQVAQQLASRHFLMREVYAAARATQQKDRAGEHCAFIAKKYQEMAKEYETLAAVHKTMAEPRK
jgi:HD-like signal output (HDOD) protein